jgi:uncharacterized protein
MNKCDSDHVRRLKEHWALSDGSAGLVFDRDTVRMFPVDSSVAEVLDVILGSLDQLGLESPTFASVAEIFAGFDSQDLPNPLAGFAPPNRPSVARQGANRVKASRYLNKLAINVANDCNLACTYCYANQGLYRTPDRSLLSVEDIERFIERFADRFDFIEGVQFMGGEPSMNPSALERAGATFCRLVDVGLLLGLPRYTLVTNGLTFSNRFLTVCKEMNIELTVSLDGPEAVHDTARVRRNGKGSYRAVRANVEAAKANGIAVEFEPTFSRAHLVNGISLIDLVQWFHDEFGIRTLHAPPMSENRYETEGLGLSAEEKMREYCAVTEWGIDNIFERRLYLMHSFTERLLASFESRKKNPYLCPAGNSLLSISTGGKISPCWMFTDEAPYHMGHVDDRDLLGEEALRVKDSLQRFELRSHPECRACLIQPVCFGCKGGDYHATGTPDGKTNCDYMRAMVVTAMMRIFSRPNVPSDGRGYYERPAFGTTIYETLRPKISTAR